MYSINEYCGLLVKQAREEKNWTQQDLADEVDMDVRTIEKIEEGTTSSYYLTIEKLIYALNIAPNIMYHERPQKLRRVFKSQARPVKSPSVRHGPVAHKDKPQRQPLVRRKQAHHVHEISNDVMENTGHEFTFAEAPPDIRLEIESRFGVYLDQLPQYRYIADDMFKSKS